MISKLGKKKKDFDHFLNPNTLNTRRLQTLDPHILAKKCFIRKIEIVSSFSVQMERSLKKSQKLVLRACAPELSP
jgi:hypothetical protein